MTKPISQNPQVSEAIPNERKRGAPRKAENVVDFADQRFGAKSHIQALIGQIARATNRHKLDYPQLKYIFREVRRRCGIEVPNLGARKLVELPTVEELVRFYGVIDNPVHRLMFETLEETGLRVSELCGLLVARIDFDTNLIFVNQGKGKKDRITVIGNHLREKLHLYLENRNNRYLFESARNTKYTSRRIEQICKAYKVKAGIEKELTPHTFRHLWNTALAIAGLSEERRALLAGHDGDDTQKIYTHLGAGGFKHEVVEILDRIAATRKRS